MEFSEKITRIARILLAVFMAVASAVMWLESRSELSAAIRGNQPYIFWLDFSGSGVSSACALLIYQPQRRIVDLIQVPGFTECRLRPSGDMLANRNPLTSLWAVMPNGNEMLHLHPIFYAPKVPSNFRPLGEVPLDEVAALSTWTQGLGFWRRWPDIFSNEVANRSTMPAFDRLLVAVELKQLPPENVRAAWLPESEDQRRFFFGNILAPPSATRNDGRAIAVEVLNATRTPGIASTATDVLRLHGADVVNVGNAPSVRDRTVIYDRTGRAENAEAVRDYLGCRQARVVTQISPKKLVDVTVALAEDCASLEQRGLKWNWLKF